MTISNSNLFSRLGSEINFKSKSFSEHLASLDVRTCSPSLIDKFETGLFSEFLISIDMFGKSKSMLVIADNVYDLDDLIFDFEV